CSTLNTACRSLLCLMTMPGRIWVAGIDMRGNYSLPEIVERLANTAAMKCRRRELPNTLVYTMDGKVVNRWSLWLARPSPRNPGLEKVARAPSPTKLVQPAAHNPSPAGQHSVASPFLTKMKQAGWCPCLRAEV